MQRRPLARSAFALILTLVTRPAPCSPRDSSDTLSLVGVAQPITARLRRRRHDTGSRSVVDPRVTSSRRQNRSACDVARRM